MKHNLVFSLCFTVVFMATGCGDNKKETTVTTTDSAAPVTTVAKMAVTEGKSIVITDKDVPDSVSLIFRKKYPTAQKVVWMKYEPVESDELVMDDSYYYVRFNSDGSDYTTWYNNRGEWVKTSTRIPNTSGLPDAVNNTITTQFPGYEIVEIDKENDKNRDMYEIELKKGDDKVKLKILPNGEIYKRK
ncbi:MAG TPA: PepSY-like domain-containing protein [Ferruginibacter sp.]|nr:PepSY-like domain-containing protein [Ferruginibacter sp.]